MEPFNALVLSLPTRNSTLRMRVWRGLKESVCGVLRDGVYVLPASALELKAASAKQFDEIRKLFDRSAEYGVLVKRIADAKGSLARLGPRRAQTAIRRLERAAEKLSRIDFFASEAKGQAAAALAALKASYQAMYSGGEPRASKRGLRQIDPARYQKRLWATRKAPWVDRLASAWLIKRFIDREARFAWIARPSECPQKAVGFDFDGAEFTHVKNRVTFEVLLASFGLDGDSALVAIGASVHYLDVGGIPVADANGLETVLKGIKEKARDDDVLLAEAMRILDFFYSAYRQDKKD